MDPQDEQELCRQMVEAQTLLEQVREQIRATGAPVTPEQRDRLDQAELHFRAVKDEYDAR